MFTISYRFASKCRDLLRNKSVKTCCVTPSVTQDIDLYAQHHAFNTSCRSFYSGTATTFFNDFSLSRSGIELSDLLHARRMLYHWATAAVVSQYVFWHAYRSCTRQMPCKKTLKMGEDRNSPNYRSSHWNLLVKIMWKRKENSK